MENGMQPYDDELLVEGMYKAWDGFPTGSNKVLLIWKNSLSELLVYFLVSVWLYS
jgi:hypothetical protein